MTNSSSKLVPVIATKKIGKYASGERIEIERYAARVLVAMGKAKFENQEDEFRNPPPKKSRVYKRRDMAAEQ